MEVVGTKNSHTDSGQQLSSKVYSRDNETDVGINFTATTELIKFKTTETVWLIYTENSC